MSSNRCKSHTHFPPTLEDFVLQDDNHLYNHKSGLANVIHHAEVHLINATSSLQKLHDALEELDLLNSQRMRPSWDLYFMQLASLAAQRSNCMKRRVGCVLVREKRVISTGYNGTPRNLKNCNDGGCNKLSNLRTYQFAKFHRCQVQRRSRSRPGSLNVLVHTRRGKRFTRSRTRAHQGRVNFILRHVR